MLNKPEIQQNRITIPSDPALIREVDEFVELRLREHNLSDTLIADIAICATEIVNNGINHGNKRDLNKTVTLELKFGPEQVVIVVTDQGGSFDPQRVEDPVDPRNLLREVGRGIFIVRHLMDTVEIGRAEGGGTVVTITKKIA
jgi:serine/threonine-protein kinase RsbW